MDFHAGPTQQVVGVQQGLAKTPSLQAEQNLRIKRIQGFPGQVHLFPEPFGSRRAGFLLDQGWSRQGEEGRS
ncbi:MAG: hypothetical protein P4M10_04265 [Verrucomicrobiae bacterium]|nr:hypothetical protein [Verrucomicrobiae bacterium]